MTPFDKSALPDTADAALELARQAMDRADAIARSQLDFAEQACREVFGDCSAVLTLREPVAIVNAWPTVFESIVRNWTDGSVAAMRDQLRFNREMIEIVHQQMPVVSKQVLDRALNPVLAASNTANDTAEKAPVADRAVKPAVSRAKKAA